MQTITDEIDEPCGVCGHQGSNLHTIGVEAELGKLSSKTFDPGPGPGDAVKVFTSLLVASEDQDVFGAGPEGAENMKGVNSASTRYGNDGHVGRIGHTGKPCSVRGEQG